MISRFEREHELISSGMVDSIKNLYKNKRCNIPNKYYVLIADYIDSVSQVAGEGGLYIDPVTLANKLPQILSTIIDTDLGGIYGRTDGNKISMNSRLNYEKNKLYFFHELTHALQTRQVDNSEECSFYNGHTGMFLAEGATQFTAEILYHVSDGGNLEYTNQTNTVRGQSEHTTYSALQEYQLNGNILLLMSGSLGIPLNQLLALGYRSDGREQLKGLYESFPGQEGKFEEFMLDLEKIYSIDKLVLNGQESQINKEPVNIRMVDGQVFKGNMNIENELIKKTERNLAANFIANNDPDYIMANYNKIEMYLTTGELRQNFQNAIAEISKMVTSDQREETNEITR